MTENKTQIDDLVHFTLREWSRLSYNVTEAETERAKAQLKASILLSLDGTTGKSDSRQYVYVICMLILSLQLLPKT